MVDPEKIGLVIYSKVLDRNFTVIDGPSDEYYRLIGLESILKKEEKKERQKFPKIDPDTKSDE